MMTALPVRSRLCPLVLALVAAAWLSAACSPRAAEPTADAAIALTAALAPATTPALAAYPGAPTFTPPPPPYPWPTPTPGPTNPPDPTEPPTETPPPVPTPPPTPVVTPIPTTAPPFIPFPEGTTPQPFTLYWRDGGVIRLLHSTGDEPVQLFLDPAAEFGLYLPPTETAIRTWGAVSPDGRSFALVLTEQPELITQPDTPHPVGIYLLDKESRDLRLLAQNALDPVWSPDGQRVAFRSTSGLSVVEVFTGEQTDVFTIDGASEHVATDFTWSPDSQFLIAVDRHAMQSAVLVHIDASQREAPRLLVGEESDWLSNPQWSPTQNEIAFLWSAEKGGVGPDMCITDSTGSLPKQITRNVRALGGPPQWSPDGQWIAFSGPVQYEMPLASYDLWLTNSAGTDLRRLFTDQSEASSDTLIDQSHPIWSPDGTQLVYTSNSFQQDQPEVRVISLIDGVARKMISDVRISNSGLLVAP